MTPLVSRFICLSALALLAITLLVVAGRLYTLDDFIDGSLTAPFTGHSSPKSTEHDTDTDADAAADTSLPNTKPDTHAPAESASPDLTEPLRTLPSEYYDLSEDEERCRFFYGEPYLRYLAEHQNPYCEEGSESSLTCFHVENTNPIGQWGTDPLCLARGAKFTPGSSGSSKFSLSCQRRNFTREKLQSDEAATRYQGVKDIEDFGSYFFQTGAGEQLWQWRFETDKGTNCTKEDNDGKWILLARREGNGNIWHKLMEVWQALLSVQAIWLASNPSSGRPYLSQHGLSNIQVVFEDDRTDNPWDPLWTMVTGNEPIRLSEMKDPSCLGNVILPLAGSSSPFWSFVVDRTDRESCSERFLIDYLVGRTLNFYNITSRRETEVHYNPVVTIIDRKKTRVFANLEEYVAKLKERNPNVTFNVVDFATLSMKEQIELAQSTDVLVGHHGAGMTHVLFQPPGAAAVEIFPPPKFPMVGFRHIALMRRIAHFSGHSMWEQEWEQAVNGTPIPEDWKRPVWDEDWQTRSKTYMLEEDFVGLVEAAIRNQRFKSSEIWE